ncbi:MAG: dicarboxylate transporter, DctM subunit [Xanthobacteraceae bacterium]|jgi:tripartite ATP-independent transporter DctM subunit|nr:dicarboxylate transporter, DctM subunit [Xanthobacteraceae bacterium]
MALTFGLMALFLVLGAPLAVTFGLVIFLQMGTYGLSIAGLSNIPYEEISSYPLVAIPLFMLTGELMNRSGMAAELIALADLLLRRIRAAFGYITVAASAMMGAITGSSVATVAAVGGIVSPEMIKRGYPKGYVASLTASAGLLGVLVPPSIPLILYGATVGVSISQLFIATMVPAVLMAALFLVVHNRLTRKVLRDGVEGRLEGDAGTLGKRKTSSRIVFDATSALLLPVVILGGIYGGIMTPTEAAAIGCLYAIGMSAGRRLISREGFTRSFRAAAITGSGILVIIAMTGIFNRAMVLNQVPQDIAIWVATYIESPIAFLLMVNVVLLLVGTFMETNASILLMGPLLAPAAERFGIDPVHFGIVIATNLEIGLLTPPMAANLYVAARAANARLADMMPYLGWFFGAALLGQAIITFVPFATLWFRYL